MCNLIQHVHIRISRMCLYAFIKYSCDFFAGILLRRIINDMNKVINGTLTDRKINLFSGHDVNVAALLCALNIFDYQTPKFSSSVIIELHEKGDQFYVKVRA